MTPALPAFQALTIRSNGIARRLISDIDVMQAFDPQAPPNPLPHSKTLKGLWDTGATGSVITPAVAAELGLVATGTVDVARAGGVDKCPTYTVNFRFPHGVEILGATVTGHDLADIDALIGMDIITLGDFSLTHSGGSTCMSFRVPSLGGHDFVQEHQSQLRAAIGRNDPCPCGKRQADGRPVKFKNCCGK